MNKDTKTILLMHIMIAVTTIGVQGHGRLLEPPSRASMWRFGFQTPIDYNDNQLFCGGFTVSVFKYTTIIAWFLLNYNKSNQTTLYIQ